VIRWFVLGFTVDDVVGGWQDARLASECVRALRAAGRPAEFRILQTNGDGDHLFLWFVNDFAARVLDAHAVPWRPFLVGEAAESPAGGRSPLTDAGAEPA
jgi:hypothetical protein